MKRAMVVTVGTGIGKNREEALKSIARAIVASINDNRHDRVVFMVSRESQEETLPLVIPNLGDIEYEEVVLESIDDILHIYEKASRSIQKLVNEGFENTEIIVDYTSGTKTMSCSAVLAAMRFEVGKISYVSGKRGDNGVVLEGTERFIKMMPTHILMQKRIDLAIHLFNVHRFESCLEILKGLANLSFERDTRFMIKQLNSLSEAYNLWDKFDHKGASGILLDTENSLLDISQNKRFLGLMQETSSCLSKDNSTKWDIESFYIADILNNGERRAGEGRYDDAVARLYRVFELLAQRQIRKMGLCEEADLKQKQYSINVTKLNEDQLECLETLGYQENNKVKPGLFESYKFLELCKCPVGLKFGEDKNLHHLLSGRNGSILAHGLNAVRKNVYDNLLEKCNQYITEFVDRHVVQLKGWAKFPVIERSLNVW